MKQFCDVVMEGGGVKGLGIVGALTALDKAGFSVRRVAGTSAGAIVGSLVAAGMPIPQLKELMGSLDYRAFRDEGLLDRLGVVGKGLSLAFEKGIYEGHYLRERLAEELAKLGVRTFADLKLTDPWAQDLPPEQRYKLVVNVADISRGRLVHLPWDYSKYGLDPDKQLVADAVRASMSLPFFYEPARLDDSFLVDGALLSNFPINLFDSTPEWPTLGIKLSSKPEANMVHNPVQGTYGFARALLATMMNAHDAIHLDDPCTVMRTMFVDTMAVKVTDFDITPELQQKLYENGLHAGEKFLKDWDFENYKKVCLAA
jgi:NTE family protein